MTPVKFIKVGVGFKKTFCHFQWGSDGFSKAMIARHEVRFNDQFQDSLNWFGILFMVLPL